MKKSNKIKIICVVSAAAVICSLSIGLSLAYLGDSENKDNTMIAGHGDVSIIEEKSEPSELEMLNEPLKKEYSVANTGTVTSFARLYAEFSDSKVAEHIQVKYKDKYGVVRTALWNDYKDILKNTGSEDSLIESDWRYIENDRYDELEGYFYYTKPLAPGEATPPLITDVILDFRRFDDQSSVIDDSNIDRISNISKVVYAELVQTVETDYKEVTQKDENDNYVQVSVYGYDYAGESQDPYSLEPGPESEWKNAWISFLVRN